MHFWIIEIWTLKTSTLELHRFNEHAALGYKAIFNIAKYGIFHNLEVADVCGL